MANKVYINPETAFTWDNAGTGAVNLMDLGGLAAAGLAMGTYQDLGVAPRSEFYQFEMLIDGFDTAPVVGEVITLYFSQSNSTTNFDGNPTTDPTSSAQGTITLAQAKNCLLAGVATVYSTTAADELKITGLVRIQSRYVAPVVYNGTADALLSTADAHLVTLTPVPQEIQ